MTTARPRNPAVHQQKVTRLYPFPQTGVSSTGNITCVANASMTDGDFITVPSGIGKSVLYEYDKSANGVTAGRVSWAAGASTAADVAATLRTAILANQAEIGVTDNLDGTLTLTHKWPGAGGNVTITENVSDAGFTVSGLSGGVDPCGSVTADTTLRLTKVKTRGQRLDRVSLTLVSTLTGHASNFCNFKLIKNASTVMANWSTSSAAQGTITANTPVDMVLTATKADRHLADGDTLSLLLDVSGTTTVPPGAVEIESTEL